MEINFYPRYRFFGGRRHFWMAKKLFGQLHHALRKLQKQLMTLIKSDQHLSARMIGDESRLINWFSVRVANLKYKKILPLISKQSLWTGFWPKRIFLSYWSESSWFFLLPKNQTPTLWPPCNRSCRTQWRQCQLKTSNSISNVSFMGKNRWKSEGAK